MRSPSGRWVLVALAAALSACAVGPQYRRPDLPIPKAYKEAGAEWISAAPGDQAARGPWWQVYGDPVLDALEARIESSNQTLKAALAAYDQSLALVRAGRANFWPTLAVAGGETRSARGDAPAATVKSASATASWEPDVWGRVRRSVESARSTAEANAADLAATRLSLETTLATDYFELRIEDALLARLDATVKADQEALTIAGNRYRVGVAAKGDVVTAQAQLLGVQAQQFDARIARAQLEHAIAVLLGVAPADFDVATAAPPGSTSVPAIPLGVPSDLLQRRPDVAALERRVAAANAQIGVARSAWFPSVTLGASDSYTDAVVRPLFELPNRIWSVGPLLAETLFDGGARRAQSAQARAAYDQAAAQYRAGVLAALQQVEDQLVNLRLQAQQAEVEDQLIGSAREAERLTLNQYQAGTVPYSSVIAAQTTTLASEQSALNVLRSRLVGSVALIGALGGGWQATR